MPLHSQPEPASSPTDARVLDLVRTSRERLKTELSRVIVGQAEAVDQLLVSLFVGGHCLITGAPGLAKTLLVKSIAKLFDLEFQRIQFTPDLMPADITGTEILEQAADGSRKMVFVKGPIFANVLLADEINRTPPKTQAALLEAMQEQQVTVGGVRYALPQPFFVLATQNPIEMEGTYPLPEAQLDRFMLNVLVDYLPEADEVEVVRRTTRRETVHLAPLFSAEDVLAIHDLVRAVPISDDLIRYAVRIAAATRPCESGAPAFVRDYVGWGAGLRAAQNMVLGAKAQALLAGRAHVVAADIQSLAGPVLRHRVLLNYKADAAGMTIDTLIGRVTEAVRP